MKKLMVMLIAIITLGGGITSAMYAAPDYEQCVTFRNVKATLIKAGNGMAYVYFESSNDGTTKVSWCVNGKRDGKYVSIKSDETLVPANGTAQTEPFSVKDCDQVWIKIFNCNKNSMY